MVEWVVVRVQWFDRKPEKAAMVELACGVCAVLLRVRVLLGKVYLVVMLGTVCRLGGARDMVLVQIWPYELLGSPRLKVLRIRHHPMTTVTAMIAICSDD